MREPEDDLAACRILSRAAGTALAALVEVAWRYRETAPGGRVDLLIDTAHAWRTAHEAEKQVRASYIKGEV